MHNYCYFTVGVESQISSNIYENKEDKWKQMDYLMQVLHNMLCQQQIIKSIDKPYEINMDVGQEQKGFDKQQKDEEVTDSEYFSHLKHYKPIFYSGKGSPLLLANSDWHSSLSCLAFSDILYICIMVLFVARYHPEQPAKQASSYFTVQKTTQLSKQSIMLINIGIFLFINVTYLLTQFLNPGIVNLTAIPTAVYQQNGGKIYCSSCNGHRTKDTMKHCRSCDVCVWGLDHHCGFFNKCIAGYQKFAFYGLMLGAFAGFMGVMVTATFSLF